MNIDLPRRPLLELHQSLVVFGLFTVLSNAILRAQSIRDSASVRIIENSSPAWAPAQRWQIGEKPTLSIGLDDGGEPYLLNRVHSAVRLLNGQIVIGNSGSSELRFFDANGKFMRNAGRRGGGPGEFDQRSPIFICVLPGDDLVAADYRLRRAHIFSSRGEYKRTFSFGQVPGTSAPLLRSCFEDGTILTTNAAVGLLENTPGALLHETIEYFRYRTDGRSIARLASTTDRTRLVFQAGGITEFPYVPFTPESFGAAARRVAYINRGGAPELERRKLDGTLEALIRWRAPRTRTSAIYDRYVAINVERTNPQDRPRYRTFFAKQLPVPDLVPAVGQVIVDELAYVWVMRYQLPWDTIPTYEVFEPNGRWLGQVSVPARFDVFQIGKDFVLGRQRDDLGVERVVVHTLIRRS
jgi:6-bladed beta-propeller protein